VQPLYVKVALEYADNIFSATRSEKIFSLPTYLQRNCATVLVVNPTATLGHVMFELSCNKTRVAQEKEAMKLRGISIHAVSQIEARRLLEYGTAQAFGIVEPVAACYIATIPGAQIWFEYSIDGPHPPNAMYLFKLLLNGQNITTWVRTVEMPLSNYMLILHRTAQPSTTTMAR